MAFPLLEFVARATLTIGGSKDAQCSELTVIPTSPLERMATPVGMKLAERRNKVVRCSSLETDKVDMRLRYRKHHQESRRFRKLNSPFCYDSKVRSNILGAIDAKIDETDWLLLQLVQTDARLSFAELGRRAGMSPPAAAERLRRLQDAGVILGYHARISPERLGLALLVFIEVQVKRSDYSRFQKAVQRIAWILECHHTAGRASFILKAAVPDTQGLELLIGHLSQFGETNTTLAVSTVLDYRNFSVEGTD
jgi:Lrp/AsnC family leucine-responsive transcriptional regulator